MRGIVIEFNGVTKGNTYPCKIRIRTGDEISDRIRLFGEVFELIKVEDKGYKEITVTCDKFPISKQSLIEDAVIDGVEYELVAMEKEL